jgi:hypothetical protein
VRRWVAGREARPGLPVDALVLLGGGLRLFFPAGLLPELVGAPFGAARPLPQQVGELARAPLGVVVPCVRRGVLPA